MQLSWKYRPVAENGPRFAADVVVEVWDRARIRLDYSVKSLALVDRVLEGLRRDGPPVDAVTETLFGFGTYTGQVLVRQAGARWVDFDLAQRDWFGQDFGVQTPDGRAWNPLGRAFKRFHNGPEDSLHFFSLTVVGTVR